MQSIMDIFIQKVSVIENKVEEVKGRAKETGSVVTK